MKKLLIAGPCSAESKEQLSSVINSISSRVDYIRAGIWKPRTRPGTFEGVGEIGLKWIQELKTEKPFKFATEVATSEHVELCLKYGVNLIWIGARTTANPFAMQELAEALKGVDIPVMLKNPVNPDSQLWIGAVERVLNAGVTNVSVVHRGFNTLGSGKFRNKPLWNLVFDFRTHFPKIPVICDPSHISGKRDYIFEVCQTAYDLNFDGLMIEVHNSPDKALSDAKQQITPTKLFEILNSLKEKKESVSNEEYSVRIKEYREELDLFDREIVNTLEHRMLLIQKVGKLKKRHGISTFQHNRLLEILKTRPKWVCSDIIDANFIDKLFKLIHDEAVKIQQEQ